MQFIKGPDFPTGGVIIDSKNTITSAYETGRGVIRIRAKWEKQILSHGLYQIIITEIPYQVQKSKLIENIANLMKDKKLPFLDNIRDESTEDIRIVLEPKNRSCDPDALMNSLFKLTDLETRFHLNFNVLDKDLRPRVMNISELIQSFLDHRFVVVTRRSEFRLEKINHRLEVLEGLKIAYLNLDEVINIIREEDDPKQKLMQRFCITELQSEAILNLRLRSLRKLEELEINREINNLTEERQYLNVILTNKAECLKVIKAEIMDISKKFGDAHILGPRKTTLVEAQSTTNVISIEAFIEKEPITVFCSQKGWIKSLKGHLSGDDVNIKYKEGDNPKFIFHCHTTDKILIFTSMGRFYTIFADDVCKSKGFGEPIRLMVDLAADNEIISMLIFKSEDKLLLAAKNGKGFIVEASEALSQTKLGKQIFNLPADSTAILCLPVNGDSFAIIGSNRKLLVGKIEDIPIMKKGQGVKLQKYNQAYLEDIKIFNIADGLCWKLGDRIRTEIDLSSWLGKCGFIGKLPPAGFPKNNKFSG